MEPLKIPFPYCEFPPLETDRKYFITCITCGHINALAGRLTRDGVTIENIYGDPDSPWMWYSRDGKSGSNFATFGEAVLNAWEKLHK